jgi:hypothetical protein
MAEKHEHSPDQGPKPETVRVELAESVTVESADYVRVGQENADGPNGSRDRPFTVRLSPASEDPLVRSEVALWDIIQNSTERLSFRHYLRFMDGVLKPGGGRPEGPHEPMRKRDSAYPRPYNVYGSDAYDLVREATILFMMQETGRLGDVAWFDLGRGEKDEEELEASRQKYIDALVTDSSNVQMLPYMALIRRKLAEVPIKSEFVLGTSPEEYGILRARIETPVMIELIWSYWHEQGMLVQTMNAISMRFQNRRSSDLEDALLHLALDPVRPLNNLIWGWVQDEASRLTVARRAYEYDQEYGLLLSGKAVPDIKPVERRSKFIECFHNLLHECVAFFKERDDLTVKADGFPLLNSINDVHLLLAESANNSFGDLPWVARCEMLIMQWLLARPEFREFLGGRLMVPYAEPWMDRVDTMRMLQRWGDVSITSFNYLAHYGERILLSVRYGNWSQIHDPGTAAAWADKWRSAIQTYVHHYRRVTGVDLGADILDTRDGQDRYLQPSVHIIRRLAEQRGVSLPPPASLAGLTNAEPTRVLTRRLPQPSRPARLSRDAD